MSGNLVILTAISSALIVLIVWLGIIILNRRRRRSQPGLGIKLEPSKSDTHQSQKQQTKPTTSLKPKRSSEPKQYINNNQEPTPEPLPATTLPNESKPADMLNPESAPEALPTITPPDESKPADMLNPESAPEALLTITPPNESKPADMLNPESAPEALPTIIPPDESKPADMFKPEPAPKPLPAITPPNESKPSDRVIPEPESKPLPSMTQHVTLPVKPKPIERIKSKPKQKPKIFPKPVKKIDPLVRGGKSRESHVRTSKQTSPEFVEKPEISCWKRERSWVLSVELPENIIEQTGLCVRQNNVELKRDESVSDSWQLVGAKGSVAISWGGNENQSKYNFAIGTNGCILFKLNGTGRGCNVKTYTYGQYLAIAPNDWQRDENLSGLPPAFPEPVSIDGYQAHFFFIEKGTNNKIAFSLPDGTSCSLRSNNYGVELIGKNIEDACENMGPLFIDSPPKIHFSSKLAAKEIKKVVVGEEGGNGKKWRAQLNIIGDDGEDQSLGPALDERGIGWFFLRLYNSKDDLVDSFDFRFVSSLRDVKIANCPVPSETGHLPAIVEFHHDTTCQIQPIQKLGSHFEVKREAGNTIAVIPPDPALDKTTWFVRCTEVSSAVRLDILIQRFWWCLSEGQKQEKDWQANLVSLKLDDFRAISKTNILFKLPKPRWTDAVMIGFAPDSVKKYEVMVKEDTIMVPLRHFCDDQSLKNIGTQRMRAWVKHHDESYEVAIGELSVRLRCRLCDFNSSDEEIILGHVRSEHLNESFDPLTYDELRRLRPDLPAYIYACPYCDYYSRSDDLVSHNSDIYNHVTHFHRTERVRFRNITNIEEIEEILKININRVHRCIHCQELIEDNGVEKLFDHLEQNHKGLMYWLC